MSLRRCVNDLEDSWVVQIDDIEDLLQVDGISKTHEKFIGGVLDRDVLKGITTTVKGGTRFHINKVLRDVLLFNRVDRAGQSDMGAALASYVFHTQIL